MFGARTEWAGLLVATTLAALAAACGGTEPVSRLTPAETERARELFSSQTCGACHGELGEGLESGPALRSLAPYWNEERLISYLRDPEGFREANPDFEDRRDQEYPLEMPAFAELPAEDLRLLARWLMTR